ncbi:acetamidase/formamidase family protein [Ferruginibacter paludis]|uniref:acetamidase/formamidase family protein n=1 Tax=Ferruginibacter paludis TaxID=1310417 RepID=UPI0025B32114|nr:acetamidase/formamidase family protein [Ferruginibacter paludis]MDN3657371.1 acetamidase/formamidase family protein [Ferruginibacter paludis]
MKKYFVFLLVILSQITFGQNKKSIDFYPTTFYGTFSPETKPALSISPGDTIYTESVDAFGIDKNGKQATDGKSVNPLTGPFYIRGASKGDILVITFTNIALNRPSAISLVRFVPRSLPDNINLLKDSFIPSEWELDLNNMTGSPKVKYDHLHNFYIVLNPFLGDVGVAPSDSAIASTDAGPYGGNFDFSRLTTSSKLYLPVFHEGALLYMGDGHAAQGDGEINLTALETSMNIGFTVQLIKDKKVKLEFPRIEDETYFMAVGLDTTLDNALKIATKGLLDWLQQDYQLSLEEATQVIGSSIEYRIAEIADPKVEVVAMIKKAILKRLTKTSQN